VIQKVMRKVIQKVIQKVMQKVTLEGNTKDAYSFAEFSPVTSFGKLYETKQPAYPDDDRVPTRRCLRVYGKGLSHAEGLFC